jgi:hypothetical protein
MKLHQYLQIENRSKIVGYIFIFVIIVYGLVSSIWLLNVSSSIFNTIGSISLPNGYFYARLNPVDPELNLAFGVTNCGYYDLNELGLHITFDIQYYQDYTDLQVQSRIFTKNITFGVIRPFQSMNLNITSELNEFNITALNIFYSSVNNSKHTIIIRNLRFDNNGSF